MYTLDFETVKQVMHEHRRTGLLYADVPAKAVGMSESCRIEIDLVAGSVVSCAIVGASGRRLSERESLKKIVRLGMLKWVFEPRQQASTQPDLRMSQETPPLLPVVETVFFPQRIVQIEQWQMRSWSRIHRGVFALSDGATSISKIADVLSTSSAVVEGALRDLQSIGAIIMRPQSGRPRM